MTISTKERLAEALRNIGLEELAQHAENGLYCELDSQLAEPFALLTFELGKINTEESCNLAHEIINGKYEQTNGEMSEWFASLPDYVNIEQMINLKR